MNENIISRDALEKALWEWDSFSGDSAAHAALLVAIDAYAAGQADLFRTHPTPLVESYLHLLVTLAEQLLDSSGRVKLVTERNKLEIAPDLESPGKPGTYFNTDGTITCKDCSIPKAPEEFYRDRGKRTGRKSQCKECRRQQLAA